MGSASEEEDPVDLWQFSQFHLGEWAGPHKLTEGLLDQPVAAELFTYQRAGWSFRRGLNGVPNRSSGSRTRHLPLMEHQQIAIACGMPFGLRGQRGGDQAVLVLHQRMAQVGQL